MDTIIIDLLWVQPSVIMTYETAAEELVVAAARLTLIDAETYLQHSLQIHVASSPTINPMLSLIWRRTAETNEVEDRELLLT